MMWCSHICVLYRPCIRGHTFDHQGLPVAAQGRTGVQTNSRRQLQLWRPWEMMRNLKQTWKESSISGCSKILRKMRLIFSSLRSGESFIDLVSSTAQPEDEPQPRLIITEEMYISTYETEWQVKSKRSVNKRFASSLGFCIQCLSKLSKLSSKEIVQQVSILVEQFPNGWSELAVKVNFESLCLSWDTKSQGLELNDSLSWLEVIVRL